jgi:hypothetical protein
MRRIYVVLAVLDLAACIFALATHQAAWKAAVDASGFGLFGGLAVMDYWRLRCYELADTVDQLLGRA